MTKELEKRVEVLEKEIQSLRDVIISLRDEGDEDAFENNPLKGDSIYRYLDKSLVGFDISPVVMRQIASYMSRKRYVVVDQFTDNKRYNKPYSKAYLVDDIREALSILVKKDYIAVYFSTIGNPHVRWHTEYYRSKNSPELLKRDNALKLLLGN